MLFYKMNSDHNLLDHNSLTICRPQCLHTTNKELQPYLTDGKTETRGTSVLVILIIRDLTSQESNLTVTCVL